MKLYIATVINNMILEDCQVFSNAAEALSYAKTVATSRFSSLYIKEIYATDMRGWIIGETPQYFITVVERDLDAINYLTAPYPNLSLSTPSMSKPKDINRIISDQNNDNPKLPTLPGGFSLTDNKPLFMSDIRADGLYFFKLTKELSPNQLNALLQARLNKRPNFLAMMPEHGLYSQTYALREVKNKSVVGQIILDLLKAELDEIYIEAEGTPPSDDQYDYSDSESLDDDSDDSDM